MPLRKLIACLCAIASLQLLACKKSEDIKADPGMSADDCSISAGRGNGEIVANQYIISYQPGSAAGRGSGGRVQLGTDLLSRHGIERRAFLDHFEGSPGGFIAQLNKEEAGRLQLDENISRVEPDRIIALSSCFTVVEPLLITWNIERTGYGDGRGKTAWVIDTGIDTNHPDLDVDKGRSRSFLNGISSFADENGHGTHVAGIIAAKNNNIGVLGVASGAKLVSLRVLDKDGKGLLSNIVQALAYINQQAAPGDVVNMSVGDEEGISATLDEQVGNTASRGILFAIAAGNEKQPANKFSPARVNGANIYTVSAIDSLDNFAGFSNYGNDVVDYALPGVRILSTYKTGKYAYMSGTSMAAPHMAGLLLLKGRNINSAGTAKNDPDGNPDPIAHY